MEPEDEVAEIAELYFSLLDLLNLIETAAAFLLTSCFLIDLHSISSFSLEHFPHSLNIAQNQKFSSSVHILTSGEKTSKLLLLSRFPLLVLTFSDILRYI